MSQWLEAEARTDPGPSLAQSQPVDDGQCLPWARGKKYDVRYVVSPEVFCSEWAFDESLKSQTSISGRSSKSPRLLR